MEVWPQRTPTKREASDSGSSLAKALKMPWFPTHTTVCNGRPCAPGEGNLKGYKMWGQPYLHREDYVQSRSRRPPHPPDPQVYAGLVALARRVQSEGLVILTSGDWDYREIVMNWVLHAHGHGYHNSIVLSMDVELHSDLMRRNIPAFDNSALLDQWNSTCLQRHIQKVRMERQLALAALLAVGYNVLHTDATAIFVKDVLPMLRAHPNVDILVQRDGGPGSNRLGCSVTAGFTYVRSSKREALSQFLADVVRRGLVEFYLRWANNVDQFGWSHTVAESELRPQTSRLSNETTIMVIKRRGCQADSCLRLGFLPFDKFPRIGAWPMLRATALIHHLVSDGALGAQYHNPEGVRPFHSHRQRLDRYDETDFGEYRQVVRQMGLWLVDSSPNYHSQVVF